MASWDKILRLRVWYDVVVVVLSGAPRPVLVVEALA